jgi:hypothetical protein
MLKPSSFIMKPLVTWEAQVLLATNALCCAFLRLTFLTNSDPLVLPRLDWLLAEFVSLHLLGVSAEVTGGAEE